MGKEREEYVLISLSAVTPLYCPQTSPTAKEQASSIIMRSDTL